MDQDIPLGGAPPVATSWTWLPMFAPESIDTALSPFNGDPVVLAVDGKTGMGWYEAEDRMWIFIQILGRQPILTPDAKPSHWMPWPSAPRS